jgi:hypothetical protein
MSDGEGKGEADVELPSPSSCRGLPASVGSCGACQAVALAEVMTCWWLTDTQDALQLCQQQHSSRLPIYAS